MYKKILTLLLLVTFFGFTSAAFAVDNEADVGASITVDDGDGNSLTFNFSPSVAARYETSVSSPGNEQDYTLGTYHVGGALFYGTSSSETSVYKKDRTSTADTFSDGGYVTAVDAVMEDGEVVTPGIDAVVSPWLVEGSGWSK